MMQPTPTQDSITFNGVNGATGEYLFPPYSIEALGRLALGEKLERAHRDELDWRRRQSQEATYALKAGLDPEDLSQAGWGVIFPAAWSDDLTSSIRDALDELLQTRKSQAGDYYCECIGMDGYRLGESKDDFVVRHGGGPGPVDPEFLPYYLLIVGGPDLIPFQFQFELDVAYSVGRIEFDDLEGYASYARTVVACEKGEIHLPRHAVFFGVANPGDQATELSADTLVRPLAEKIGAKFADNGQQAWKIEHVQPQETTKSRLSDLFRQDNPPGFLFTASHGLGFPYAHPGQKPFQGAFLCQDWPGPQAEQSEVSRDHFFAAEDVASDDHILGMISFHFACFGGGTPYWDDFSKIDFSTRTALAPDPFIAALPKRLLGHPRGGALAVAAHIDRAWTYSFRWGDANPNTTAFESALTRLLQGQTAGMALDDFNLRYAELATMLSNEVERAEYQKPDLFKLARYWTAHNDARDYILLGDPAVKIPATSSEEEVTPGASIEIVSVRGPIPSHAKQPDTEPQFTPAEEGVSYSEGSHATSIVTRLSDGRELHSLIQGLDKLTTTLPDGELPEKALEFHLKQIEVYLAGRKPAA